jgi:hypothetical protein
MIWACGGGLRARIASADLTNSRLYAVDNGLEKIHLSSKKHCQPHDFGKRSGYHHDVRGYRGLQSH